MASVPVVWPPAPQIYYPRCVVSLYLLFDDQVTGLGVPATYNVIPRNVDVMRNSARKADECRLELDFRDAPLDPRILQDVLVYVHIDDVPRDDFPIFPYRGNMRFAGRADEIEANLGDSTQIVTISCRDFSGIWLDYRWPQATVVDGPTLPTPLGTTLAALVELMRLQVTPLLPPAVFTDPAAALLDVHLRTGRLSFVSEKDDNAWDVLSALCELFGLVPVFELDILTIRTPTLASANSALLIYGQNVETLKFSRDLKPKKRKQVRLVAWNPDLQISLEALYPPTGSPDLIAAKFTTAKTPKPIFEQVIYHVEGPYTLPDLLLLAQRVWTEAAQNQLVGELETRDLRDLLFGDSLLGLANGDVLICKLGTEDLSSIASMSAAEAIAFLSDPTKPGAMNSAAALALVDAWQAAQQLSITFYITEVAHKWSRDDGYRLTIRFRDFVLGI